MKKNSLEFFASVLICAFTIFIFTIFYKSVNRFNFNTSHNKNALKLKAQFNDISGISVGSQVKLAGVVIGQVDSVELNRTTFNADLELSIYDCLQIPDDSTIIVSSNGLLGGKFIEVRPGSSDVSFKADESFIYTVSSINIESLISKFVTK